MFNIVQADEGKKRRAAICGATYSGRLTLRPLSTRLSTVAAVRLLVDFFELDELFFELDELFFALVEDDDELFFADDESLVEVLAEVLPVELIADIPLICVVEMTEFSSSATLSSSPDNSVMSSRKSSPTSWQCDQSKSEYMYGIV